MATPLPLHAGAPPKKKSGCIIKGGLIFIVLAICLIWIIPSSPAPVAGQTTPAQEIPPQEPATHPKPDYSVVESTVASLVREKVGARYIASFCVDDLDGKGWIITLHVKAGSYADHPEMLKQEMIELASLCHPSGMKILDFTVLYFAEMTDGLGNTDTEKLLNCRMRPAARDNINWGNRKEDLFALTFSRIFETRFCHRSYQGEWKEPVE